jgi:uncharacterized protein (TIGR03435 family)
MADRSKSATIRLNPRPNPQATDSKQNSQDRRRPDDPALTRSTLRKPVNLGKVAELLNVPGVTTSYSLIRKSQVMKLTRSLALCLALTPLLAYSQTTPAPPAFEVVSIKAATAPTGPGIRVGVSQDKGRVTMSNVSLSMLLTQAYKLKQQQLVAPDWMDSTRFDIVAKLPEGATREQVPAMLQTMLADRFKVKIHKESKVLPIYAMVVAKGGPKLKETDAEAGLRIMMSPKGREMTGKATLSRLADSLSNTMDRQVIDMTELKGAYEIDLTWSPDESDSAKLKFGPGPGRGPGGEGAGPGGGDPHGDPKATDGPDAPNIFVALQEKMGLKLEPRKAPADIIVVDQAEKVPTEN